MVANRGGEDRGLAVDDAGGQVAEHDVDHPVRRADGELDVLAGADVDADRLVEFAAHRDTGNRGGGADLDHHVIVADPADRPNLAVAQGHLSQGDAVQPAHDDLPLVAGCDDHRQGGAVCRNIDTLHRRQPAIGLDRRGPNRSRRQAEQKRRRNGPLGLEHKKSPQHPLLGAG